MSLAALPRMHTMKNAGSLSSLSSPEVIVKTLKDIGEKAATATPSNHIAGI
jgi:hypothetical protein